MIQNSPDLINSATQGAMTPLASAAFQGQLRVAQYLLDHGANVNLRVNGSAPLHQAVLSGNKAMVELLLTRGADIGTRHNAGDTPLHTAVRSGFRAVAGALLEHKADVNARNSDINGRETPLHIAAAKGNGAVSLSDFIPPSDAYIARVLKSSTAQNVLTSGSDLSHVKITRRDLKTKKTKEWVLDRSHMNENSYLPTYNSLDLLLRDGDVIEVPEK